MRCGKEYHRARNRVKTHVVVQAYVLFILVSAMSNLYKHSIATEWCFIMESADSQKPNNIKFSHTCASDLPNHFPLEMVDFLTSNVLRRLINAFSTSNPVFRRRFESMSKFRRSTFFFELRRLFDVFDVEIAGVEIFPTLHWLNEFLFLRYKSASNVAGNKTNAWKA